MKISDILAFVMNVVLVAFFTLSFNLNRQKKIETEIDLLLFYGSFDKDQDGCLYVTEIVDLYDWIKAEIAYHAHDGYQTPLETYTRRSGDCLDIALVIAHCLYTYYRVEPFIGDIALDNDGQTVNHATCLMPLSSEMKDIMNEELGYEVNYFQLGNDSIYYVIIDPLCCSELGKLISKNFILLHARPLRDYPFNDLIFSRVIH